MSEQAKGQLDTVMQETRLFPPPADFAKRSPHSFAGGLRKALGGSGRRSRRLLGSRGRRIALVSALAARAQVGTSRSPSGLPAEKPTPRSIASTGTSARRSRTSWHSSGKESQETRGNSLMPSCTARSANSPACSNRWALSTGDVVSIYMPMVPELVIAMLACAGSGRSIP